MNMMAHWNGTTLINEINQGKQLFITLGMQVQIMLHIYTLPILQILIFTLLTVLIITTLYCKLMDATADRLTIMTAYWKKW